jgi:small-conductance mechanosensitive channel
MQKYPGMNGGQFLIGSVPVENILMFFVSLGGVTFVSYFCYKGAKALLLRCTSQSVARWAARLTGYLVFGLGLYTIDLYFLGFDINATITSLGILSIALAFASQQIIANLLAGILIAVNRTIRLDDWVHLGGEPGTGISQVKDMTFTRTILRDMDGRVFLVPNATLLSSKIVNYSKSGFIEVPLNITIPAGIPFDRARDIILAVLAGHESTLPGIMPSGAAYPSGMRNSYFFSGYTGKKAHPGQIQPRVLFTGITPQGNAVSIRFWIRDVLKKEEIISDVLADMSKKLETGLKR